MGVVNNNRVKVFFYDFGTTAKISVTRIKILIEEFTRPAKKALRGCLHGIKPRNGLLWNLNVTKHFITSIAERIVTIEIVKFHENENFYEFLLFDSNNQIVNSSYVAAGLADPTDESIMYPPFDYLEKCPIYVSFSERNYLLSIFGFDFNSFEASQLPLTFNVRDYENTLRRVLEADEFAQLSRLLQQLFHDEA